MPDTPRLALPYPLPADTADVPRDVKALADKLDENVAVYAQGALAARPAFGIAGRTYFATDAAMSFFDTGAEWLTLAHNPGDLRFTVKPALDVGWLACDGASVLRAAYPALYAAIGATFGSVDGAHFGIPDYRGRSPIGAGVGDAPGATAHALGAKVGKQTQALTAAELPAHAHPVNDPGHDHNGFTSEMDQNRQHSHTLLRPSQWATWAVVGDPNAYDAIKERNGSTNDATSEVNINHLHAIAHTPTGVSVLPSVGGGAAQENRTPSTVCNIWIKT